MKITIRRDNDPFKKYWWVLLLSFGLIGGWICLPLIISEGGQAGSSVSEGSLASEQSLDSAQNPNGAPGGAIDLSMGSSGARRKQGDTGMVSSLYQAPETGAAAPGTPVAQAPSSSLASALKAVSEKTADSRGWGGQKAQRGFTAPSARFGALSGLGGAAGSGGNGARGFFGTSVAKTSLVATQGFGGSVEAPAKSSGQAMSVLKGASAMGMAAASHKSNDSAAALAGRSFDGGKAGSALGNGGRSTEAGGMYAGLDVAPANLKANQADLDHFELKPPPAKLVGAMETGDELKQKLMMIAVGAVVGGVVGGPVGTAMVAAISAVADSRNKEGKSGSDVAGKTGKIGI